MKLGHPLKISPDARRTWPKFFLAKLPCEGSCHSFTLTLFGFREVAIKTKYLFLEDVRLDILNPSIGS